MPDLLLFIRRAGPAGSGDKVVEQAFKGGFVLLLTPLTRIRFWFFGVT
jgi:hypothetical protein